MLNVIILDTCSFYEFVFVFFFNIIIILYLDTW